MVGIFSKAFVKENHSWIYSMSGLRKSLSKLPVNLWLDEGEEYIKGKHAKRVKFQLNSGDRLSGQDFASMTLDGNIVEKTYDKKKSELDAKDLKAIHNFVLNNKFALNELADERIYMDQFLMMFIPGGEPATQEQLEDLEESVREFVIQNGY